MRAVQACGVPSSVRWEISPPSIRPACEIKPDQIEEHSFVLDPASHARPSARHDSHGQKISRGPDLPPIHSPPATSRALVPPPAARSVPAENRSSPPKTWGRRSVAVPGAEHLLDHPVQHRRDAKRSFPSARFVNLYFPYRLREYMSRLAASFRVPSRPQQVRQFLDGHAVYARCSLVGLTRRTLGQPFSRRSTSSIVLVPSWVLFSACRLCWTLLTELMAIPSTSFQAPWVSLPAAACTAAIALSAPAPQLQTFSPSHRRQWLLMALG